MKQALELIGRDANARNLAVKRITASVPENYTLKIKKMDILINLQNVPLEDILGSSSTFLPIQDTQ